MAFRSLLVFGFVALVSPVFAQTYNRPSSGSASQGAPSAPSSRDDAATQEALHKTQQLLQNAAQRNAAIKNDPKALSTDRNVEALAGSPENKERIYKMAADIMANIVSQSDGDPKRMQELLQAAQRNPAVFMQSLTPAQRSAIEALARDISTSNPQTGRR